MERPSHTTDWSFVLHVLGDCDLRTSSFVHLNCVCNTCMFCACQKRVITETHQNDSKQMTEMEESS